MSLREASLEVKSPLSVLISTEGGLISSLILSRSLDSRVGIISSSLELIFVPMSILRSINLELIFVLMVLLMSILCSSSLPTSSFWSFVSLPLRSCSARTEFLNFFIATSLSTSD